MSEKVNSMPSDCEIATATAKTHLLLALYSHVSHDLERTRSEADRLRNELTDVRRELDQAERQLGEARDDVTRVHRQLHETLTALDRATEGAAQLRQQHEALLNSTSWRITAPIRAVTHVAKRQ